jgi:hypothetical protein
VPFREPQADRLTGCGPARTVVATDACDVARTQSMSARCSSHLRMRVRVSPRARPGGSSVRFRRVDACIDAVTPLSVEELPACTPGGVSIYTGTIPAICIPAARRIAAAYALFLCRAKRSVPADLATALSLRAIPYPCFNCRTPESQNSSQTAHSKKRLHCRDPFSIAPSIATLHGRI